MCCRCQLPIHLWRRDVMSKTHFQNFIILLKILQYFDHNNMFHEHSFLRIYNLATAKICWTITETHSHINTHRYWHK